jgi:tRNA-Thr(GGU) m(6)t(6)A37 methyltransferase TsaA
MTEPTTPTDALGIVPIGFVRGGRAEPIDDDWGEMTSRIVLDDRWPADALAGLEAFSHLDVVYVFDRVDDATITVGARHPRGNTEWPKVGIFAQRAKGRPNRIGVSTCEIVGVDDHVVTVRGLDAIDGTPVVDLKPYMVEFAPRTPVRQPDWSHELMRGYWHTAPDGGHAASESLRMVRLTDQLDLARAAFRMMHDVFDEGDAALSDDYVARLLADPRFHAIASVEAGEPVGCITAHDLPMTREERSESFVYDLAVRQEHQRRGIGRRLVEALVDDAARRGIDVVFVPADNDDDHALAFYTSLGGRPAPVTMFDLGAG